VRRVHLRAHCHRQEEASTRCLAIHVATDSFRLGFRENPAFMRLQPDLEIQEMSLDANQLNFFTF
jgi:hypothetical protein